MPQQKGRKHKRPRDRERQRSSDPPATSERGPAPPAPPSPSRAPGGQPALPSTTARSTGFLVAIFTAALAVLMIYNAITSGDSSAPDAALRIFVGTLLVLLALFVGALVLFPARIRDFLSRRRAR